MVGGDPAKFRAEDFYSPNSTAWLWKQTLYLALEVVKELPHEVTGS
jgi:hypothetical protein